MSSQYKHLGQAERDRIKALLDDGYGVRKIGRTVGIPHSTVSRELRRNGYGNDGRTLASNQRTYDSTTAQHKAYARRKYAKYQGKKIEEHKALRDYVITGLRNDWNPDEISGSMKETGQPFYASKTAIYEWLYSAYGQPYCQYLPSKQYKPKKRTKHKTKRVMIPNRVGIDKRPAIVNARERPGDWEGDTVVSGKRTRAKEALAVTQERQTKYLDAMLIPNLKPKSFTVATNSMLTGKLTLTLSLDNGIENKEHADITAATGVDVYFCEPYSSYQKGGVENANKMLRKYLPKGCDLSAYTQAQVDDFVARINRKPRRCLGYKSALQCALEKGVITDQSGALRG